MSIRLEMLQVARLAPTVLGESSDLVADFITSRQNPDGGFASRSGSSDLYYTVFGIDCLASLQKPVDKDRLRQYLQQFGEGEGLDFVHLCCLTHCHAALEDEDFFKSDTCQRMLDEVTRYRSADGGFHPVKGSRWGTAYACFLGYSAHANLRKPLDNPMGLVQCLKLMECSSGGWANERGIPAGATNSTAAAVTLLRQLEVPVNQEVGTWLLSMFHEQGGFLAMPLAPMPDLLSTATALHALAGLQVDLAPVTDKCLDFIDTLWTNSGAFHGNWADEHLDCEYTFYGLLALGHLSVFL
jgi:prenyltransferase beta subunit